jgi:amino acid adenylation domain-containing protein/non-ribosomal peptide synthase protein (TIGR01720 family)
LNLQGAEDGTAYCVQCSVLIEGRLDVAALRRAVNRLGEMHEILHTDVLHLHGPFRTSRAVPSVERRCNLTELDLRDLPEREQPAHVAGLLEGMRSRPAGAPDTSLLRLGEERWAMVISVPAVYSDAAGLVNMVAEIARLYEGDVSGRTAISTRESLQYADVSEVFNDLLEGADFEAGREYWERRGVLSASRAVRLGIERPRPGGGEAEAKFEPRVARRKVFGRLAAQIDELAGRCGVGVKALMFSCWQVLLWRLTGRPDVWVGAAFENRDFDGLQDVIGPFEKHLPLRSHLSKELSFKEVLRLTEESLSGAAEWQDYFSWEHLADFGAPHARPLFSQFAFEFENAPPTRRVAGLAFSVQNQYACTDRFELKLSCLRGATGNLVVSLHYDAGRFHSTDIERLAGEYVTLLRSAVRAPETKIHALKLLTEAERNQLLNDFKPAPGGDTEMRCLHETFEEQARRTPLAVAVVCEGRELTYAELDARADLLARRLRHLGVGPERLVGVLLERSEWLVVAILGVLKAGGAYVPLDATCPAARVFSTLDDAGAAVLLTERSLALNLPEHLPARLVDVPSLGADEADSPDAPETEMPRARVCADNSAYVIYTSGSTGRPKGVAVSHRNVGRLFASAARHFAFSGSDCWALFHSAAFDFSVWEMWGALLHGGRLVVVPYWVGRSPEALLGLLSREGVTVLSQTPSAFQQLMREEERGGGAAAPLRLREVVLGGEALEAASLRTWVGRHGTTRPRLINMYGITETTVHVTYAEVSEAEARGEARGGRIGKALEDLQCYVLDEWMEPVAEGMAGELFVGGAGLARGYLNRPALTAERFVPNPFGGETGARLYRTGDTVRRLRGGELEYVGRRDSQVKVRGHRIEPGEVEAALLTHGGVREAVVVAGEDGAAGKRLMAYVVADGAVAAGELRRHLAERLPDYMIPSAFMMLGSLPLTVNGKIDRSALPVRGVGAVGRAEYVAPRNESEGVLCRIWGEVLGAGRVGVHDNFFELGGDSILSIQVVARANREGLRLTPRLVFEHQSVAGLAAAAEAGEAGEGGPSPEQGMVVGEIPLTPIQRRFFEQQQVAPHHWNQSVMLSVRGGLRPDQLEEVVGALLAHHDALRMYFVHDARRVGADAWSQHCAGVRDGDVGRVTASIDLAGSDEAELRRRLEEAAAHAQAGFELSAGPLVRVVYFALGENRPGRLLLVIHHLIVEGMSWRILLDDLQRAFEQVREGRAIDLGAKTTSYKEWAEKLTTYARAEALSEEVAYWADERRGAADGLPVDFLGGRNTEATRMSVRESLSVEETRALLQDLPNAYGTQVMEVLLASLAEALRVWCGAGRVLVDVQGHGREAVAEGLDLSRTVGWFTTVYPVLLETAKGVRRGQDGGGPSAVWERGGIEESLLAVKGQLRGIPQRGIGYGLLRYARGDEEVARRLREMPQAEIIFNYLGQFDQVFEAEGRFGQAPEATGPEHSPLCERGHLLGVGASVLGGRLQVVWVYSAESHAGQTVKRLASLYTEALRGVISSGRRSVAAAGLTP